MLACPRLPAAEAAAAVAAAAAARPQAHRTTVFFLSLLPPILLVLVLCFCGTIAAALPTPAAHDGEREDIDQIGTAIEYTLGGRMPQRRALRISQRSYMPPDPLLLSQTGQQRNAMYGAEFNVYLEQLRSGWLVHHREGTDRATVRTNLQDLEAFAACAELNLELDDIWADIPEGSGHLGYRWILFPQEPLGSEMHLRSSLGPIEVRIAQLSRLLEQVQAGAVDDGIPIFDPLEAAIFIAYKPAPTALKAIDPESFSFTVVQGSGTVVATLQYEAMSVEDTRLLSVPEVSLGADGELCGLLLLRALLARAKICGLTEVRIRVESSDMQLLKAASCTGFRPTEMSIHQGRAHYTFIANPQLPVPAAADLRQKIATLDRTARHMTLTYFQAAARRCIQKDRHETPKIPAVAATELDMPKHSKARGAKGSLKRVGIGDKVHRSALVLGFGAVLLILIFTLVWRKRKRTAEGSTAALPVSRNSIAHARYHEDWYLTPPAHWPDKDRRENVYGDFSNTEVDEWKATGSLDR